MLYWIKGGPVITPLVTSSTVTSVLTDPHAGGLNTAGTTVLFGNQSLNYGTENGGRLTIGAWLDPDAKIGFNARGFLLEEASTRSLYASNSDGVPVLGIPLTVLPNSATAGISGNNAFLVSIPTVPGAGGYQGDVSVVSRSQLWGAEANGQVNLLRKQWLEVNALVGFRYVDLKEELTLVTHGYDQVSAPAVGVGLFNGPANIYYNGSQTTQDTWGTRNQFYGGQVGGEARMTFGRFFVDVTGKCALGTTHQVVDAFGLTTNNMVNGFQGAALAPTGPGIATYAGGLLNQPSNSGRYSHNDFSVLPEGEFKLGYAITSHIKATAGYNFTYWTNVARPGDQINSTTDVRQIPAAFMFVPGQAFTAPTTVFRTSDFWAQGVTFGLEFSF